MSVHTFIQDFGCDVELEVPLADDWVIATRELILYLEISASGQARRRRQAARRQTRYWSTVIHLVAASLSCARHSRLSGYY